MSHGSPLRMKMGKIGCRSGEKSDGKFGATSPEGV